MTTPERTEGYKAVVKAIHRNLVEFGYPDLTEDNVLASYDKAMAGEKASNIIDMMTKSQLEQNGLLPES